MIFFLLLRMVARVGINGFGRIGRVIFRTCMQSKELEVIAINDPAIDVEYICYLIKFDSTHGKFKSAVTFSADEISIDDKTIKVFSEKFPSKIPWHSVNVQYVVEASGMFTSLEKASCHLTSQSIKRVLVTAPTLDIPMLILGVNEEQINAEHKVISCASSTLYCLAPIVKILEDNYGVSEGFITSIHAMTPSLKPLDGLCIKGKHWRDHRSIHQNIIPAATSACKALQIIIPSVKDKLAGLAFRVPIVNVSVLDITVRLTKNTTIQDIIKCVEAESKSTMKNIIKTSKDQQVSSDFMGEENSCILDINSSLQLNPNFFKLICWYENEYSYACRVVGSIIYSEETYKKSVKNTLVNLNYKSISNQSVLKRPTPSFKRVYEICNCCTQKNPKILNTIQKSGLQTTVLSQQQTYNKHRASPLRTLRSDPLALKDNGIFKVWNDEKQISKPVIKENRNSFFENCETSGPAYIQNNNYVNNKERLEEVKKEFSKMVEITETLLKKSSQSSREINILEGKIEKEEDMKDTEKIFAKTLVISPTVSKRFPTNGVFQTDISTIYKNVFKTQIKENCNILLDINTTELNTTSNADYKKINNQLKRTCNAIAPVNLVTHRQLHNLDYDCNNEKVCDDMATQQNFRFNLENCSCVTKENNIRTDSSFNKSDLGNFNLCKKLCKHDFQKDLKNLNRAQNCLDIVLKNNSKHCFEITDKSDINRAELIDSAHENNNFSNRNVIRKTIIQQILKMLTEQSMEETTRSPSLVETSTTISARNINKGLDIYDKIDSASATDSENSFQINEKTSEVIDLTDLTSSVEDLERLDKICRIIEISDEMSDKLFSALNNKNNNTRQTKWSFKDLCERLKLDDFCNNVFGRPNCYSE
ncbi:uncharacterized protein LOC112045328 [Bicyclus anynana]|uniref:Uncharacterized protein LOC112045328 n=1 Tax=Bicyclus anynana TaxID=110368 RepID=A0A6J1MWC5_BICAN|nr:uncharacterized protein LOC112045328 [Bicyclus anynana]